MLLMESSGNHTSMANTGRCGLRVWMKPSRLTCMRLQHAVLYSSEILCVQTPPFHLSAPSMSYSCYGDVRALPAPAVPCTVVRSSDCGRYSLLDLTTCFYLIERCFTFCYCQIKCGAAVQLAEREKATSSLPKWQVLRSLQTWWEVGEQTSGPIVRVLSL